MSWNAYAVIGANWGDEGKGLAVDTFAKSLAEAGHAVIVVRSNGGAQAGHGVERPDGVRHVFHHIGAGTFADAATHLSRFFVAHPMVFQDELLTLARLNAAPERITIDPRAPVTTPWDMAINQAIEIDRAGGRHGSTGLGFGETIERQENRFELTAGDLWGPELRKILVRIRDEWVPKRLAALGMDAGKSPLSDVLLGKLNLVDRFLEDCATFRSAVSLRDDCDLGRFGTVLFEGAQGLQLDMDYGVFPHVTRSHTGIRNMLSIATEAGIKEISATYMTRAYATRHGAGPLPREAKDENGNGKINWAEVVDLTNAPNNWQGIIRQAPLDVDLLASTIQKDTGLSKRSVVKLSASLGVTCLDQVKDEAEIYLQGRNIKCGPEELLDILSRQTGLPVTLKSFGPTHETALIARNWISGHQTAA